MNSRALRGLDDHHLIFLIGVLLQIIAACADLVAYQLIPEPEGVQPVTADGAVAQANHRAAQNVVEFFLQRVERLG